LDEQTGAGFGIIRGVQLYGRLAPWWPLLSDPADYAEEAALFRGMLHPARTVLELGSGGGNNASHLKADLDLTLCDRSPQMLAVSRARNPECEHVEGDMRTLRLGRTFDAVFVHDAIMYLTTEADLKALFATAHAHLGPGGRALFVPDDTRETWRPTTKRGGHDGRDRSLRYLSETRDPDPADTTFVTSFAVTYGARPGRPQVLHEEHTMGLFPRATWLRLLEEAGFRPQVLPYRHSSFAAPREVFLGVKT